MSDETIISRGDETFASRGTPNLARSILRGGPKDKRVYEI